MGLVPRRIRMKVQSSFPAGRRINLFWEPGPNPPLWGKENVYYHTLSATSLVPNMSWLSVVQSLSCVQLFATPWTAAHHASLSFTIPQNFLKLMSIESVMPSNHLILCCPLLASTFPSIRAFSNESVLRIKWPKYWSFSVSPSNEYSGLLSFRMYWFDLLAVQRRTTGEKHQFFVVLSSLWPNSHIHTWLLEWKNDNIVILCSSWVENKRVMSCHAWKKLCHHLLFLVCFADVETKAHQVARGTHRAKRAELEWYSYLFPKFLIKALSSTAGRGYSTSSSKFRDAPKVSPPPPWAHHDGPESCQLFLDASCRLQGSLCFSLAHSDISTLHSTFPTKLKRPFSLLTPSIPSHAYSTAEPLTVWGHAWQTHTRHVSSPTHHFIWGIWSGWLSFPPLCLVPFSSTVISHDCSPSTPHTLD